MDGAIVIFIFLAVFVAIAVFSYLAQQRRRKELSAWAAAHGLKFNHEKDKNFDDRYPEFKCLRQGHSRYGFNVMAGSWGGRSLVAFDYSYTTGSGKNQTTHHFSAVVLKSHIQLKPLLIRPEGIFDKVTEFFGFDDIDFESAEFSRKFFVKSPDKKWAYDVLHPETMEFLLAQSNGLTIQFGSSDVMAWRTRTFTPAEFADACDVVTGVLDRLPEYLRRENCTSA